MLAEMQDEPLWVEAVNTWYELEKLRGFPAKGKGNDLTASDKRPSAVAAWVRNGHKKDPVEMEDGVAHQKSLLDWWAALQPDWRKKGEKYDRKAGNDWGFLNADGRNGLLSVLACMLWWRKVEKGTRKDSVDWVELLSDVTLVLQELCEGTKDMVLEEAD